MADSAVPPTRHITSARVLAVRGRSLEVRADRVVAEEPLEIRAAGPHEDPVAVAVTMRTPGDEDELAVGFLRTEGLIDGTEVRGSRTGAVCGNVVMSSTPEVRSRRVVGGRAAGGSGTPRGGRGTHASAPYPRLIAPHPVGHKRSRADSPRRSPPRS